MRTLKLTLAYDGTDYSGWQVQPGQVTLQGTLESAWPDHRRAGARRGQRPHRRRRSRPGTGRQLSDRDELAPEVLQRHSTPTAARHGRARWPRATDGFHARVDAVRKRYRYLLTTGRFAMSSCGASSGTPPPAGRRGHAPRRDAGRHARFHQLRDQRLQAYLPCGRCSKSRSMR